MLGPREPIAFLILLKKGVWRTAEKHCKMVVLVDANMKGRTLGQATIGMMNKTNATKAQL